LTRYGVCGISTLGGNIINVDGNIFKLDGKIFRINVAKRCGI